MYATEYNFSIFITLHKEKKQEIDEDVKRIYELNFIDSI